MKDPIDMASFSIVADDEGWGKKWCLQMGPVGKEKSPILFKRYGGSGRTLLYEDFQIYYVQRTPNLS